MELDFLHDGLLILDGAMGTVLQQRGLPPGGKPELLNFTRPDLLRAIYREYIQAGSQILCANTFGASTPKLAGTGRTVCLLYTSPRPRDRGGDRMPSSA